VEQYAKLAYATGILSPRKTRFFGMPEISLKFFEFLRDQKSYGFLSIFDFPAHIK
jgi:hypothetical protein